MLKNTYQYAGYHMLLQLAIDCFTLQEALEITGEVADMVDIVEAGTPLILREGIGAVRSLKEEFPSLCILADMKIVDGAEYESRLAFDAGADIVTVLAAAETKTIVIAKRTAEEYGKEVMVDLIGIADAAGRAAEMKILGAQYLCVHRATDLEPAGLTAQDDLRKVQLAACGTKIAVAGGIDTHALQAMSGDKPDIAIVGSYITMSVNRREAALTIKKSMK
jgi:3-hexulose-6-phosphate synthase